MKHDFDNISEEICDVLEINQGNVPDDEFQKFVLDIIEREIKNDEYFVEDFSQEARMWIFRNVNLRKSPKTPQNSIKLTRKNKKLTRKKSFVEE